MVYRDLYFEIQPHRLRAVKIDQIKNSEHSDELLYFNDKRIVEAARTENEFSIKIYNTFQGLLGVEPDDNDHDYGSFDYIFSNKRLGILFYGELKVRYIDVNSVDTFMIGKSKINNLCNDGILPAYIFMKFGERDEDIYVYLIDSPDSWKNLIKYKYDQVNYYIPKQNCISYGEFVSQVKTRLEMARKFAELKQDSVIV